MSHAANRSRWFRTGRHLRPQRMNLRDESKVQGLAWQEFPVARASRVRTEPARTALARRERGLVARMDVAQELPAIADPMAAPRVELVEAAIRPATASAMRAKLGAVPVMPWDKRLARCAEVANAIGMTNGEPDRGLEMVRARSMAK